MWGQRPGQRRPPKRALWSTFTILLLAISAETVAPASAWRNACEKDPFAAPLDDKIQFLLKLNERALSVKGVRFVNSFLGLVNEQKYFASTDGSRIEQNIVRTFPYFTVTAVDQTKGDFQTRSSFAAPLGIGLEYLNNYPWLEDAEAAGNEAVEKLKAKTISSGKYDLVLDWQTTRELAPLIGRKTSYGCLHADNWATPAFPRMPNVSLEAARQNVTLDDLIADTKDGVLMFGDASFSIDQQRYNFQFGSQTCYEIKNGKRGAMLRDVVYQSRTPDFWNACDGLGGPSTFALGGSFSDGKGRPTQINVLNTAGRPQA